MIFRGTKWRNFAINPVGTVWFFQEISIDYNTKRFNISLDSSRHLHSSRYRLGNVWVDKKVSFDQCDLHLILTVISQVYSPKEMVLQRNK